MLAAIQPMLRSLTAEDKPRVTPCGGQTCHEVAVHLMGSMAGLGAMAGATVRCRPKGSLESKVSQMADGALASWA